MNAEVYVCQTVYVGEPTQVRREVIDVLAESAIIAVIAPVALGEDDKTYNVNADTFVSALSAKRLLFLTDVIGVFDKDGQLIKELPVAEARDLVRDWTTSGCMIP